MFIILTKRGSNTEHSEHTHSFINDSDTKIRKGHITVLCRVNMAEEKIILINIKRKSHVPSDELKSAFKSL